jgi:hypothetical protein
MYPRGLRRLLVDQTLRRVTPDSRALSLAAGLAYAQRKLARERLGPRCECAAKVSRREARLQG